MNCCNSTVSLRRCRRHAFGGVVGLGVTSARRLGATSDVASILGAAFLGISRTAWTGRLAPFWTPKPIVGRLNAKMVEILTRPDIRHKLAGRV